MNIIDTIALATGCLAAFYAAACHIRVGYWRSKVGVLVQRNQKLRDLLVAEREAYASLAAQFPKTPQRDRTGRFVKAPKG